MTVHWYPDITEFHFWACKALSKKCYLLLYGKFILGFKAKAKIVVVHVDGGYLTCLNVSFAMHSRWIASRIINGNDSKVHLRFYVCCRNKNYYLAIMQHAIRCRWSQLQTVARRAIILIVVKFAAETVTGRVCSACASLSHLLVTDSMCVQGRRPRQKSRRDNKMMYRTSMYAVHEYHTSKARGTCPRVHPMIDAHVCVKCNYF